MQKPKTSLKNLAIVGLGNPGVPYEKTRHNAGFWVLDALAKNLGLRFRRPACGNSELCVLPKGSASPYRIVLAKPLTYMNRSGAALIRLFDSHEDTELIVVTDNMDLMPGATRLKSKIGSGGGHNGLKSVLEIVGDWPRVLYLGIGRPDDPGKVIEHVLGEPGRDEADLYASAVHAAVSGLMRIVAGDWQAGVDEINSRRSGT